MRIIWRKCKKLFRLRRQSPKKMMKSKLSKSNKKKKAKKTKRKTKQNTKLKLSEKSMWSELLKLDGGLPNWEDRHT